MNKLAGAMIVALAVLAACQPSPQPAPTSSPIVLPPTATQLPTVAPTVEPTATPTLIPTVTPTTALALTPTAQSTLTPTTAPVLRVQVNSPDVGYVNIRNTPSTSGALVVQVKDQATLDVLETADTARAKVGQQGQWLQVRTSDGKEGFVAAWYVRLPGASPAPQPVATSSPTVVPPAATQLPTVAPTAGSTPTPAAAPVLQVQVNSPDAGYVNIRSTSSTSGELVVQVKDQAMLDVLETADTARAKVGQQGQWLQVRTSDGKEGFVAAWYVRLPGASPVPAPSPTSVGRVLPTPMPNPSLDVVVDLLNRTNALRAENGLPPYKLNDLLNASARRHSDDMASTGLIDHTGADGSSAKQRVLDTGYEAQLVGENIYGGQVTVDDAWNYWVNDPSHRAVLLNAQYVDIGISVVKGKGGWYYFTMDVARPSAP